MSSAGAGIRFETKQARMSIANIIVTINNSSGVEQKNVVLCRRHLC